YYLFFFSSRRPHTRSTRDWSSDVWSSDLPRLPPQKNFNDNSQEKPIGHPVRDASLQHTKSKNVAGFNRLNTLPGRNIRPYPDTRSEERRVGKENKDRKVMEH